MSSRFWIAATPRWKFVLRAGDHAGLFIAAGKLRAVVTDHGQAP